MYFLSVYQRGKLSYNITDGKSFFFRIIYLFNRNHFKLIKTGNVYWYLILSILLY